MDTKKLFEIYQTIWHHTKEHVQDIQNSTSDSWWDEELEASEKILATVDDEPEYIQKFARALLAAVWELLNALYKEGKSS